MKTDGNLSRTMKKENQNQKCGAVACSSTPYEQEGVETGYCFDGRRAWLSFCMPQSPCARSVWTRWDEPVTVRGYVWLLRLLGKRVPKSLKERSAA